MARIVRIVLAETNNDTVTLSEKLFPSDEEAWTHFESLVWTLTGEHRKKPLDVNTLKK